MSYSKAMALLELFPVLMGLVNLNLVKTDIGEPLFLHAKLIPASDRDQDAFIRYSDIQKRELDCPEGRYLHPDGEQCCLRCPKGTYVAQHCLDSEESQCLPCPKDTFTPEDNFAEMCLGCRHCRTTFGQIMIAKCTRKRDTVCGCPKNQYRSSRSVDFMCRSCSVCPEGRIKKPCGKFRDTVCEMPNSFFRIRN